MSASSFERSLLLVQKQKGGYVDQPKDSVATNLGVTILTLNEWLGRKVTKVKAKALKPTTTVPINRVRF